MERLTRKVATLKHPPGVSPPPASPERWAWVVGDEPGSQSSVSNGSGVVSNLFTVRSVDTVNVRALRNALLDELANESPSIGLERGSRIIAAMALMDLVKSAAFNFPWAESQIAEMDRVQAQVAQVLIPKIKEVTAGPHKASPAARPGDGEVARHMLVIVRMRVTVPVQFHVVMRCPWPSKAVIRAMHDFVTQPVNLDITSPDFSDSVARLVWVWLDRFGLREDEVVEGDGESKGAEGEPGVRARELLTSSDAKAGFSLLNLVRIIIRLGWKDEDNAITETILDILQCASCYERPRTHAYMTNYIGVSHRETLFATVTYTDPIQRVSRMKISEGSLNQIGEFLRNTDLGDFATLRKAQDVSKAVPIIKCLDGRPVPHPEALTIDTRSTAMDGDDGTDNPDRTKPGTGSMTAPVSSVTKQGMILRKMDMLQKRLAEIEAMVVPPAGPPEPAGEVVA